MHTINASVGRNGTNHPDDVKIVQELLNRNTIPGANEPLQVDGICGPITIACIELFQAEIMHMRHPDGLVEPGRRTIQTLKDNAQMNFSDTAMDFMKGVEQLRTQPYDDQTGRDIDQWVRGATIGYGHLISADEWPQYAAGISAARAEDLFREDLAPFVQLINDTVTAVLQQHQFDALVILCFNIGAKALRESSVLKLVNDPNAQTNYPDLEAAWKAWNKSQGRVSQGLINRRNAEWNIYSKNIYQRW